MQITLHAVPVGQLAASTSKSVVLNFNASKGDDTDGNCAIVLGP